VLVWLGGWLPRTHRAVELVECLAHIPAEKYDLMKQCTLDSGETYDTILSRRRLFIVELALQVGEGQCFI